MCGFFVSVECVRIADAVDDGAERVFPSVVREHGPGGEVLLQGNIKDKY